MRPRPFGRGNDFANYVGDLILRSFNEATAFRPWKYATGAITVRNYIQASMRPRPFGRGNLAKSSEAQHSTLRLQ